MNQRHFYFSRSFLKKNVYSFIHLVVYVVHVYGLANALVTMRYFSTFDFAAVEHGNWLHYEFECQREWNVTSQQCFGWKSTSSLKQRIAITKFKLHATTAWQLKLALKPIFILFIYAHIRLLFSLLDTLFYAIQSFQIQHLAWPFVSCFFPPQHDFCWCCCCSLFFLPPVV